MELSIKGRNDNIVNIEISGYEPQRMLNACAFSGIALWNIRIIDSNTVRAQANEQDMPAIEVKAAPSMCEIRHSPREECIRHRKTRDFTAFFAVFTVLLLCISSLFVWNIEIKGNSIVSDEQLRRSLSKSGMDTGTFWPATDAESIRAKVMADNPEIEWLSVNLHASGAEVLVLERTERPKLRSDIECSDIVADFDGIVSSVSVLSGTGLVSKGQIVERGDVLISGTVSTVFGELENVAAKGEVVADTWRSESMVMARNLSAKGEAAGKKTRYSLLLGKMRINFYRNSGNNVDGCVKIKKEYSVGVDGMFALPVSIVREELVFYELSEGSFFDTAGAKDRLYEYLSERIDGQIVSSYFEENGDTITLNAHCLENIAHTEDGTSASPGKDTYDRTGD